MPSSVPPLLRLRMRKLERLLKQERDPVPLMQDLESRLASAGLVWELRTDDPEEFVEDLEYSLDANRGYRLPSSPPLSEITSAEELVELMIPREWDG